MLPHQIPSSRATDFISDGRGVTIINYKIDNGILFCGLITVDRFVRSPVNLLEITTGRKIQVEIPKNLERQPMMTSLANQKLKIIP